MSETPKEVFDELLNRFVEAESACIEDESCDIEQSQKELAEEIASFEGRFALASGWQPIETAPKDGSEVLVYAPDDDKPHRPGRRFVAWWHGELEWTDSEGCHHQASLGDAPTHWRPLPEPPETT